VAERPDRAARRRILRGELQGRHVLHRRLRPENGDVAHLVDLDELGRNGLSAARRQLDVIRREDDMRRGDDEAAFDQEPRAVGHRLLAK
jgi:hypothetical protein